jgi:hypothetical protein
VLERKTEMGNNERIRNNEIKKNGRKDREGKQR